MVIQELSGRTIVPPLLTRLIDSPCLYHRFAPMLTIGAAMESYSSQMSQSSDSSGGTSAMQEIAAQFPPQRGFDDIPKPHPKLAMASLTDRAQECPRQVGREALRTGLGCDERGMSRRLERNPLGQAGYLSFLLPLLSGSEASRGS